MCVCVVAVFSTVHTLPMGRAVAAEGNVLWAGRQAGLCKVVRPVGVSTGGALISSMQLLHGQPWPHRVYVLQHACRYALHHLPAHGAPHHLLKVRLQLATGRAVRLVLGCSHTKTHATHTRVQHTHAQHTHVGTRTGL